MIEWYYCSKCGNPCNIRPLSVIFDVEGKKYGGLWYCQICKKFYTDQFLSYEQILELKNKNISYEQINEQNKPKEENK